MMTFEMIGLAAAGFFLMTSPLSFLFAASVEKPAWLRSWDWRSPLAFVVFIPAELVGILLLVLLGAYLNQHHEKDIEFVVGMLAGGALSWLSVLAILLRRKR